MVFVYCSSHFHDHNHQSEKRMTLPIWERGGGVNALQAMPILILFGIDAFSTCIKAFQREDILHELIPKLFE